MITSDTLTAQISFDSVTYDPAVLQKLFADTTHELTMHTTARRWNFPADPLVEYEPSDEEWAVPLGFGEWHDVGIKYHLPAAQLVGMERDGAILSARFTARKVLTIVEG